MRRLRSYGPELLVLLGGAVFAILSHGRHAKVEGDHGFWFSAAQSLVSGGRAMHEVRLQWGPGSLWILEAVGRVFGMRVASFVVFQFVVGLLAIVGVQLFARRFLSPAERWISAAILVTLIVWMRGPGSLLYPCAFAMSQALFLAVASILLHARMLPKSSTLGAVAAGVLVGATFLTKQEFGAAAALGVGALTIFSPDLDWPAKARIAIASALAFFATYFGTLFAIADGEDFRTLVRSNLLWPWTPIPAPWKFLYRKVLGLDDPGARLVEAANSFVDLLAFGGTIWYVLYFADLRRRPRLATGGGLLAVWMLWWWRWTEGSHFLPLTLTLPAIVGASALAVWRLRSPRLPGGASERSGASGSREGFFAFLALALGALVLLQREGYRGNFEAFYSGLGYVMAVPVAAPLIWWAIRGPRSAGRRSLVGLGLLLAGIAWFGAGRLQALDREWTHSVAFGTPRGTVYFTEPQAVVLRSTYEFLRTNTSRGDPILMMPATYGMDFLLDLRSLSYFIWISPGYLVDERELIARLEATPPRAAIVFGGSLGIFHSGQFGKGFADQVVRWLEIHLPRQEPFGNGKVPLGTRFLPAAAPVRR